jgi:pentatricopeptide repeat protein
VIAKIEPLRPRIVELGGSRAQRDVFHDTLIEACFRGGDMDRAERLLAERLERRPDHFWLHRRPAAGTPSPR